MDKPFYTRQMVWVCRCRQCKYGEMTTNGFGEDGCICVNKSSPVMEAGWIVPPDWYCADGEWRDEDAD